MAEKLRTYTTGEIDAAIFAAGIVMPETRTIAEGDITAFCGGCDDFKGEGISCRVLGANGQARCAAQRYCGYAIVNGREVVKQGSSIKSS